MQAWLTATSASDPGGSNLVEVAAADYPDLGDSPQPKPSGTKTVPPTERTSNQTVTVVPPFAASDVIESAASSSFVHLRKWLVLSAVVSGAAAIALIYAYRATLAPLGPPDLRTTDCREAAAPGKAVEKCSELLTRYPDLIDAYLVRGEVYRKLQRDDDAIRDYTKVLELDANNINALKGRAQADTARVLPKRLPETIPGSSAYLPASSTSSAAFPA